MKKTDLLIVFTDGETITVKSHTKCEYVDELNLFFILAGTDTEVKAIIPRERVKYIVPAS